MMRWAVGMVRRALGTVILLLLLVSGAEVAVRILEVQSPQSVAARRNPSVWDTLTTPSWTVRQELRPLTTVRVKSVMGDTSHPLQINSFGVRGPETEVPKPPNLFRVVCLGDESLLSPQQPEESHFCTHLHDHLQARTKLTVEVCNAGIPGACPLTEFLLLTHRLAALQPDLVVLTVSEADLQDDLRYRRYTRYDRDGVPLACRHPSLSRKPRTDPLSVWRQEFRLLDLGLHWAGDTWRRKTEFDGLSDSEHSPGELARLQSDRQAIDHTLQPLVPLAAWCRQSSASLCVLSVGESRLESPPPETAPHLMTVALRELTTAHSLLLVEVSRSASANEDRISKAWSSAEHETFAAQLGNRVLAETTGPWNSPYFQPEPHSIAPVSLEIPGGQRRGNVRR